MKFITNLAYILHSLPQLVEFRSPRAKIDYDSLTCKASSAVLYRVNQAVPMTADSLFEGALTDTALQEEPNQMYEVDITIKRYNTQDDIDTSMTVHSYDSFDWTLNLPVRKETPASGPLYVALHTQGDRIMVIGYINCADNGGKFDTISSSDWDRRRLSQSMEISSVWTHSRWRRKGIASEMLKFALRDIAAYTPSTHAVLIALIPKFIRMYREAGFVPMRSRDDYKMGIELPKN